MLLRNENFNPLPLKISLFYSSTFLSFLSILNFLNPLCLVCKVYCCRSEASLPRKIIII